MKLLKDNIAPYASLFLLFIGFVFLFARGLGVLPSIMADEWHYSLLSRLQAHKQADDPVYVFLGLYKLTNLFAGDYLNFARLLNTIFYIGGCGLVFLTSRLFLTPWTSVGVMVLALLSPEGVYTVFFMPESMYFFFFWLFSFISLRLVKYGNYSISDLVICGGILGISSLIKPHGLFLLVCFLLFIMFFYNADKKKRFTIKIRDCSIVLVSFLLIKWGIGFIIAGRDGITLLGNRYNSMAAQNITLDRIIGLLIVSAKILINHLSMLFFVFFVPIFSFCILLNQKKDVENSELETGRGIVFFILTLIIPLLIITVFFTASVAGTNPYDVIDRVHLRYYNFIFPLFFIMSAWLASQAIKIPLKNIVLPFSFCIIFLIIGYLHMLSILPKLQINFVDSPGFMILISNKWICVVFVIFSIASALLTIHHLKKSAQLYLLLFIPSLFFVESYYIQKTLNSRKQPDVYDLAGIVVSGLISDKRNEHVTVVGQDEARLYKTSFYIDKPNTSIRIVDDEQVISNKLIPPESTQVVVIGDKDFNDINFKLMYNNGFRLYSLNK